MDNILFGKYISFAGDSICAGAGFPGGYGLIIASENSMNSQNVGANGASVVPGLTNVSGHTRRCICDMVLKMDVDADYAILEGGVNDAGVGAPLGSLSAGYDADLDTTTFYGAFELMLKRLITRFHGKKYGYIAVHQISENFRITNDPDTSYYWAARRCCEKWGVPFLDLNATVPPFSFFKPESELFELRKKYTSDGLHPNEDCYRKYYVPKITAWLKTL